MPPKRLPLVTRSVRSNGAGSATNVLLSPGSEEAVVSWKGGDAVTAADTAPADAHGTPRYTEELAENIVTFSRDTHDDSPALGSSQHVFQDACATFQPTTFLDAVNKRVVICEICLEEGVPGTMVYHGGDQWTHREGECWELFSQHLRSIDRRSCLELMAEVTYCGVSLDAFQNNFGGDREYSVRALQETRSQALVALHRRLRAVFWILHAAPYGLSRNLRESILAFLAGSVRLDVTPQPFAEM
eukprot:TRINITY_DN58521_c0_g1_i1.p1 TRINITY_DN58521_c0_g1~~TRINITY_DN58521_c0_g1_i1.p1  ORF type:complete len:244 (+),score=68.60 TRINITY_DN58521_c0_g1_i1:510-1241(+)